MTIQKTASVKWRWLCLEGLPWINQAASIGQDPEATRKLFRKLNPWQAAMVSQQLEFRKRAHCRFPDSTRWLWTDRSLQQASDWKSAVFKARLIPKNQLTIDACCGAGADLVALAQRSMFVDSDNLDFTNSNCKVMGIDCDPQLAEIASANLKAHGLDAEVVVGHFPDVFCDAKNCWIHIDPDRRPGDRRTTKAEYFVPPLESFLPFIESAAGAIIKLAPATELPAQFDTRFQRGWIGSGGQCKQQLLIRGIDLSKDQTRFAALCDNPDEPQLFCAQPQIDVPIVSEINDFVFECHPVLHASGLHAAWANDNGLQAVGAEHGYFTGNQSISSPWLQSFRVLDILSWDQRKLRQWLRLRDAGIVEVKKRLIDLDANRFQRELSKPKGESISLLVTKLADRTVAIACQRLRSSS